MRVFVLPGSVLWRVRKRGEGTGVRLLGVLLYLLDILWRLRTGLKPARGAYLLAILWQISTGLRFTERAYLLIYFFVE